MAEIVIFEKDLDLADNICEILKYGNFTTVALKVIPESPDIPALNPSLFIIGEEGRNDQELMGRISKLCNHFHCPLVVLSSGLHSARDKNQCACTLKTAIVNKPFTFRSLHSAINKLLKGQGTKATMYIN
ncbi:hypothetical protein FKX85_18440 [Echinicola soli]|uniref:Response regulatory domain-containing protein n=1 Tax=Echinicola soli TaxID=2591634 RepID=A0A514CM61_9BACT|nr:hypothetical protein [Echinicola soli]QDH80915.1 hypothetical protein FKX85_18440 [Echinicola soli]